MNQARAREQRERKMKAELARSEGQWRATNESEKMGGERRISGGVSSRQLHVCAPGSCPTVCWLWKGNMLQYLILLCLDSILKNCIVL